jgi:hypothetical protein
MGYLLGKEGKEIKFRGDRADVDAKNRNLGRSSAKMLLKLLYVLSLL